MPEFYIKKGLADVLLTEWIAEHVDEPFIRVNIEVESKHDRLRRSFHALIREWFNSGEFSANCEKIKTYEALRDYYKLEGCEGVPEWYRFGKYNTKNKEDITKHLDPDYHRFIVEDPKSWKGMSKAEKSRALNCLLTEIKMSMCNNEKVLEWVYKITHDIEMLQSIYYHKNIGG